MFRKATVKNSFYPDDPVIISEFIEKYRFDTVSNALGVICPHAGYLYSGETAVKTLSSINIPDRVIIISPNHTGSGESVSVAPVGAWETPFGDIDIDSDMMQQVLENSIFKEDSLAHLHEHSIEVILPILKYLNKNVRILPITVKHLSLDECQKVADGIASVLKTFGNILIIASSDMNHFESKDISEVKDKKAIKNILDLDPERLYNTVINNKISMCGVFPVVISIMVLNNFGAKVADLLHYTNSGYVNRDFSSVVGYAGIVIK